MKKCLFFFCLNFLWLSLFSDLKAQPKEKFPDPLSEQLQGLKFRNIGPHRGGRSNAVCGVIGHPMTYYMGTVGGGVFKTTDAGISWKNITDGQLATGSVGAIAVAESDPNVIYLGMGEHAVRGVMTSFGDGVYKSTDAGKTWKHIGLPNSNHISRIRIHPQNPELVYVAVQGAQYGPNKERGIYRSVDGGKKWEQVLFVNNLTGASDISMDMNNPRILYASMWDHQRFPWTMRSGGEGSGIYKSTDSGDSWEKLTEGLPKLMGKTAVDVSRANAEIVYANIEAEKGGVYKSIDAGKTWKLTSDDRVTIARSWYYNEIYADPQNEDVVYVMNAPFLKSIDGGKTFKPISVPHGDQHDLWINPNNNQQMINANDGGANISFNGGASWSAQNNQVTAQFYRVITDNQFPYRVYAGQQDNSSVSIMSRTNDQGIGVKDWTQSAGGESAFLAFDENNPTRIYGGSYQGNISYYDVKTGISKDIMAYPVIGLGSVPSEMKYRFNWNSPIVVCPQDPQIMYHGANHVLKTTDGGMSWAEISPDLTRNDSTKQGPGGIPFTNEGAGGENYNTISYIAASPHQQGVLYVGTDDGLVHFTRDDGANWENITPRGLQESLINNIEISTHDPATVYLAVTRYRFNEKKPMVFISNDYGRSWSQNIYGFEKDAYVRVIREDKLVRGLLYAGTEKGLYISQNYGGSWAPLQLNLPVSPINDLTIRDNDLIVATSGRAFWILDDLAAIQSFSVQPDTSRVRVFTPKPSYKFGLNAASKPVPGIGQNPLPGVILDYFLPEKMDSSTLQLEILDKAQQVIRTYSNKKDKEDPTASLLGTKKGLNRFNWNLRKSNLPKVKDLKLLIGLTGHTVPPGDYQARWIIEQDTHTVPIKVLAYPGIEAEQQDFEDQYAFLNEIEATFNQVHKSVNRMNNVKEQLKSQKKMLEQLDSMDVLISLNDSTAKEIDAWLENLIQAKQKTFQDIINFPNQLNAELLDLKGRADGLYPKITTGSRQRLNDLNVEWEKHQADMKNIVDGVLSAYGKLYREKEIPVVVIPKK